MYFTFRHLMTRAKRRIRKRWAAQVVPGALMRFMFLPVAAVLIFTHACDAPVSAGDGGTPARVCGRVLDVSGTPIEGAVVSSAWSFGARGLQAATEGSARTDGDGRYVLSVASARRAFVLMAVHAHRGLGAAAVCGPDRVEMQDLIARPLRHVECPVVLPSVPGLVPYMLAAEALDGSTDLPVEDLEITASGLRALLPPGRFVLSITGNDIRPARVQVELDVATDKPTVLSVPPLMLRPSRRAGLYGQPMPSLAGGWPLAGASIGVVEGKWALIEFWSVGCGPCISRGIPDLLRLREEFPDLASQFTVMLVHRTSPEGRASVEKSIATLCRERWRVPRLPFHSVLDAGHRLFKRFGIEHMPSAVLVDPSGTVVPRGDELTLERKLLLLRGRRTGVAAQVEAALETMGTLDKLLAEHVGEPSPELAVALMEEFGRCDAMRQARIVTSLGRAGAGGDHLVHFLAEASCSQHSAVRAAVARSMADLGLSYLLPGLRRTLLHEEDPAVRAELEAAIARLAK